MKQKVFSLTFLFALIILGSSCSDKKSYSDMLKDERKAIRSYLKDKTVVDDIPEDNNYDPDVFYALENGVYMQVLENPNPTLKALSGEDIYIRYTETNLLTNVETDINWSSMITNVYFIYGQTSSMSDIGTAVAQPLEYVGEESVVNLIVPSKVGSTTNYGNVVPVVLHLKYTKFVKEVPVEK